MKKVHKLDHGLDSVSPLEIPPRGWRDIALRVKNQIEEDNIGIVSAGVSFYALLAIFPALSAVIALYGITFQKSEVEQHLGMFFELVPAEARNLLQQQLMEIAASAENSLTIGAIVALLFAVWSANKGVRALIAALNIVYKERETRGLVRINLISIGITFAGVCFMAIAATSVMVIPAVVNYLGISDSLFAHLSILRWPLIALIMVFGLSAIYRFAPNRKNAKWRWLSLGSVIATLLWISGSALFSIYVANFGNYNETYGSLGAVIILLMWFFVSTWIVLMGAEINAEIEHQTSVDTTVGESKPLGQRGATMADSIGQRFE